MHGKTSTRRTQRRDVERRSTDAQMRRRNEMKTFMIALAVAALGATAAVASPAATAGESYKVQVSYRDLNLNRSADAARLLHRLDRAAAEACGASSFSVREVRDAVRQSSCYRSSMDSAVASLNAPTLNNLYAQRGPAFAQN
jgi:UrcA family protein